MSARLPRTTTARLAAMIGLACAAVAAVPTAAMAATTPMFGATAIKSSTGPIADWASLSGTAPTGTITFVLYGPNNAACSGSPAFTSVKAVSGSGGYSSDWFTPSSPGTYQWIAVYSGDANNTPASTSCADAANSVTIGGTSSASVTASPSTVRQGGVLTVTWGAVQSPTSTDWIGLFAAGASDSAEKTWKYTGGTASGSTTLTVPWGTTPGTYEVRLFYNNSLVRMATSSPVTVTA